MALSHLGFVDLPPHAKAGGFDHAAVHGPSGRVYVAHTANDAVDVIDLPARRYVGSIVGMPAVAGALVADQGGTPAHVVFTSNRGSDTVRIVTANGDDLRVLAGEEGGRTVAVGRRPNGLAYDPGRNRLLVAHVGDPVEPDSYTVSLVDVASGRRVADVPVAGRTRWTVFDPPADVFHVNVMEPAQIAVIGAADPVGIRRTVAIPHAGPHGLDVDVAHRRLYCACDDATLVEVDADTGALLAEDTIAGTPDVVFFNPALGHLYVAIGEPGVMEVFATRPLRRLETVPTEPGAHTLAFDAARNLVCAFLPATHRAAVYLDA